MSGNTTNGIIDGITKIIDSFTNCFFDSTKDITNIDTDRYNNTFSDFLKNDLYIRKSTPLVTPEHVDCVIKKGSVFSDGKQWLMAAYFGDINQLKILIDHGLDKNHTDIDGKSALWFAVSEGHIPVIQYLLEIGITTCTKTSEHNEGPDTVFPNSYYMALKPCLRAIDMDNLPVVKLLEQYGCQTMKTFTALRCAVRRNSPKVVRYLLSTYEYPLNQEYMVTDSTNRAYIYPKTILFESCYLRCIQISQLLMVHGADPDPILVKSIVSLGKLETIALFIRSGVDTDYKPFYLKQLLPYKYNVKHNSIQVAEMLFQSGCSCGFFSSNSKHLSKIYKRNPQLQDFMRKWRVLENIVKPLQQLCRKFIVNHLYPSAGKKITMLPLPTGIIKYLGYPELDASIGEGTG